MGATLVDVKVDGQSVVIGYDDEAGYRDPEACYLGATVGRYANRIAHGKFHLNNQDYQLTINNGVNANHSSVSTFHTKRFLGPIVRNPEQGLYTAEYILMDKESDGELPGDFEIHVTYTLNVEAKTLDMTYEGYAKGKATPVNMTNHSYFNLNKVNNPSIEGTEIAVISDDYMDVDSDTIPTGKVAKREIATFASGKTTTLGKTEPEYDYNFFVDAATPLKETDTRNHKLNLVTKAYHPESKIGLEVYSTEPSYQIYTGDWLTAGFAPREGFAVEPGRYVNAINQDQYKDCVTLNPGQTYGAKIQYKFSSKD